MTRNLPKLRSSSVCMCLIPSGLITADLNSFYPPSWCGASQACVPAPSFFFFSPECIAAPGLRSTSSPGSPRERRRPRRRRCGTEARSRTSRRWCSCGSPNLRSNGGSRRLGLMLWFTGNWDHTCAVAEEGENGGTGLVHSFSNVCVGPADDSLPLGSTAWSRGGGNRREFLN